MNDRWYQINEVSKITGITVRTLQYYDIKGILKPAKKNALGYREYNKQNLKRLQHILFLKELDFSLKEISELLDKSYIDDLYQKHLNGLKTKRDRLSRIIDTLELTILNRKEGLNMSEKDMFESFDNSKYEEELKERYGDSEAYRESQQKTASYSKDDWNRIQSESNNIMERLSCLMDKEPTAPDVQVLIKEWQDHISKFYYNCTKEILAGLGESYVDDPRFTKNIDKFGEGLPIFFRDAIRVFCS